MSLRRIAVLVLVLAAACAKDVKPEASPAFVDFAAFDPSTGAIPLPNDLALLPQSVAAQPAGTQKDLLEAFQAMGGFPNDLEVPITIDFVQETVAGTGPISSAPDLDVATVTPATVLLLKVSGLGAVAVSYEIAGYVRGATKGTLTLRAVPDAQGKRLWEAGAQYIVGVRGGDRGVKMVGGGIVRPQPAMYLLLQGKNLADPANQSLLPDPSAGAQLELIRQKYLAPFMLVDAVFPSSELAVLQTFLIAPARTHVVLDPAAGVVPFPSNFLLDYTKSPPKVVNNPAFGPAARGLSSLDGFSTTGMLTAATSAAVDPTTVKNDSVLLFRVRSGTAERVWEVADYVASGCSPTRAPTFVAQPPPLSPSPVPTVALQPAVPVTLPGGLCGGSVMLPPLEESSDYVVVVTNRVKDATGGALGPTTPASLLLFSSPLVSNGVPTVPGLDVPTATLLDLLRRQVAPALAALPAGLTKANVAFAYPVHTQSITGTALQLAAMPYDPTTAGAICAAYGVVCGQPVPGTTKVYTPSGTGVAGTIDALFDKHGVDPLIPRTGIGVAIETEIYTLDLIDPATGAFNPNPAAMKPVPIPVLVLAPAGTGATPLAVVQHGLGTRRSRTTALSVASVFTTKGVAVAAVDLPLHGDRAFCNPARGNAECATGQFCVPIPSRSTEGDPAGQGPGACWTTATPANPDGVPDGTLLKRPAFCVATTGCDNPASWPATWNPAAGGGVPFASGEFFISTNFFRSRDAIRQHVIDAAQLVRVLTPAPPTPLGPIAGHDTFNALLAVGTVLDPLHVSMLGESLGSIAGVLDLAANPRFSRAAFESPGGTVVDVVLNSPDFATVVPPLLAPLGCTWPPTSAAQAAGCLQLVHTMKWILDPADPINFARHVTANTLPNLLAPGGIPGNADGTQYAKGVLLQLAECDQTVPTQFGALLAGNLGIGPVVAPTTTGTGLVQWYTATSGPAIAAVYPGSGCGAGVRMVHGFLINWGAWAADAPPNGADYLAVKAAGQLGQGTAADFLLTPQAKATLVVVP